MAPTVKATIEVGTPDLRAALAAVRPHRSKVKTGDDLSERNVRLTFAGGTLFVTASNGTTCALAKIEIESDTRGALGKLEPDDAPLLVDLDGDDVALILQTFKLGGNEDDTTQLVTFTISADPKNRYMTMLAVGGPKPGRAITLRLTEPADMPDVIGIVGKALANRGADQIGKPLTSDPKMLALFNAAGRAYDTLVEIRATGTAASSGFIVSAGPDFWGTIESHHDGDGRKKRDAWFQAMLELIPTAKLRAV
jgi:hypothetical protein